MAVIVGKLRVLQLRIEVIDVAQEIEVGPFALGRGSLRVSVKHCQLFRSRRIFLLLRPHRGASDS